MSLWQHAARTIYPTAIVRGDGQFLAVSKCGKKWLVILLPTDKDRADYLWRWQGRNECTRECMGEHFTRELTQVGFGWQETEEKHI
jgi:hypothetical protein